MNTKGRNNTRATAEVEPKVVFIEQLMSDLRQGKLRVPGFQRPFMWTNDRMLSLLNSIQRRYPIGSLLIWETAEPCQSLPTVGPLSIKTSTSPEPGVVSYVLDGHQRLSTLFGTLQLDDKHAWETEYKWRVFYDLEDEVFTHLRSSPEPRHFPLWKLLDTVEFLAQAEKLSKPSNKKQGKAYVERARELARVFTKYTVPVTIIRNADLSEAVEIFTLLNTSGRRITPDQILTALTYNDNSFNLAHGINKIFEDILRPHHYQTVSRTTILRVLLAALDEDIYSAFVDWQKMVKQHNSRLKTILSTCEKSLRAAIQFLGGRIGASSSKALPYALQLVLLNEFFRNCQEPTPEQLAVLERWIWVTSFSGAYMVGSSARFNEAVQAARDLAQGKMNMAATTLNAAALPLPPQFHPRSARVRAFHLFLKKQGPRDLKTGHPLEERKLLAGGLADAVTVVQDCVEELRDSLANRLLVGVERAPDALALLKGLGNSAADTRRLILESHAIPEDAWRRLVQGDGPGFIQLREAHLIQRERAFMRTVDVEPPREAVSEELNLDIEEEEDGDT